MFKLTFVTLRTDQGRRAEQLESKAPLVWFRIQGITSVTLKQIVVKTIRQGCGVFPRRAKFIASYL